MKRLLTIAILSLFVLGGTAHAFYNTYDQANAECGLWEDVSSTYRDMYTTVCNAGFMQGTDTDTFRDERELSRAEAAVIANRIIFGIEEYEEMDKGASYYKSRLDLEFSDTPPNEWWNEWILKAMYHVTDEGIMSGDANGKTFRPTDSVTTAEFMKIIYEAAKEADLLDDDYVWDINYNAGTWYSGLVVAYYNAGLLENYDVYDSKFIDFDLHYDTDDSSKHHNYDLKLDEVIDRQDAAAIIYEMLYQDIMDPTSSAVSGMTTSTDGPDLVIDDMDHSPNNADDEDALSFSVTVLNAGDETADNSVLYLYVGGSGSALEAAIPELDPGEDYEHEFDLTAGELSAQSYQNTAFVDAEDDVDESDEDNNDSTYSFTVSDAGGEPDLEVIELDHSPNNPDDEDAITFTGIVTNTGMGLAEESVLYYYVGGSSNPYEINVPELSGNGDEYVFEIELDAGELSSQAYQNRIYVDAEDDVDESNEDNNYESYSYSVEEA